MLYSPLEQFEINYLIPLAIGGWDISITNSTLYLGLILGALIIMHEWVLGGWIRFIPGEWQSLLEEVYKFVGDLINQNCGPRGQAYFPFLYSLFVLLLVTNLVGMIPYSFTVTSHIAVTLTLSLSVWIGVTMIGFIRHGFHFLHLFVPAGAPAALLPFLVTIEILSYCVRAVSLAVRLFANMMAGHTLLKIMAGFSFQLYALGGILGLIGSTIPLVLVFIITGLEIGIAALQAYVFTILSIMYINDAINLH